MRTGWIILAAIGFLLVGHAAADPAAEVEANPPGWGELSQIDPATGRGKSLLKLDGQSLGRPVVVGRTIYVASSGHSLYALDAQSGETRWQYASAAAIYGIAASPAAVFVGAGSTLVALDPAVGKVLWKYQSDSAIVDPVVVDGLVVFNTIDGPVALEQAGGKLRWRLSIQWGYFVFSPLGPGRLCIWKPDEIFVVETERGKMLWESAADQSVSAPGALPTPAVAENGVIFQLRGSPRDSEDWSLQARDADAGHQLWKTPLGHHSATGARTMVSGKTACCIFEDRLFAVDVSAGKVKWEAGITRLEAGGPSAKEGQGLVYLPELGGGVAALEIATGERKWHNAAPPAGPRSRIRIGGMCVSENGLHVTRNERMRE